MGGAIFSSWKEEKNKQQVKEIQQQHCDVLEAKEKILQEGESKQL